MKKFVAEALSSASGHLTRKHGIDKDGQMMAVAVEEGRRKDVDGERREVPRMNCRDNHNPFHPAQKEKPRVQHLGKPEPISVKHQKQHRELQSYDCIYPPTYPDYPRTLEEAQEMLQNPQSQLSDDEFFHRYAP